MLLRGFGAKVGTHCVIKPRVQIKYPWFLEIGQSSWIGEGIWIDNVAPVTIGDQVVISQGAVLLNGNHDYKSPSFDLRAEPIVINNGAWICAHSRVGPGVVVGELAVLALGAVTTKSLESGGVFSGNPAEKIRERTIDE